MNRNQDLLCKTGYNARDLMRDREKEKGERIGEKQSESERVRRIGQRIRERGGRKVEEKERER